MLIAFWIFAGLTALAFLAAGLMKLVRPSDALASSGLTWVEDFTTGPVKLIGVAEVLGALGLVLPPLFHTAVIVSPISGIALAALMVGAIVTHIRRKESPIPPLVLGILSIVAAVLGFITLV
ncbi:MAG: DoxX family protein [Curtobacterium sp.]